MYKAGTARTIGKVLLNILLFPFWVMFYLVRGVFYVLGALLSIGFVRTVVMICIGIVLLYCIISGIWETFLLLGLPLLFVYLMPYMAGYMTVFCASVTEKISDFWHR